MAGQGLQAVEVAGDPVVVEAVCLPPVGTVHAVTVTSVHAVTVPSVHAVTVEGAVGLVVVEAGCRHQSGVAVEVELGLVVAEADHLT